MSSESAMRRMQQAGLVPKDLSEVAKAGNMSDQLAQAVENMMDNYTIKPTASYVWTVAGIVAGLITLAAVGFQIAGIIQHESACDLTWEFIILTSVTQTFWLAYSIGNRLAVNTVTSAAGLLVMIAFAGLKYMYDTPEVCNAARTAKITAVLESRNTVRADAEARND